MTWSDSCRGVPAGVQQSGSSTAENILASLRSSSDSTDARDRDSFLHVRALLCCHACCLLFGKSCNAVGAVGLAEHDSASVYRVRRLLSCLPLIQRSNAARQGSDSL